MRKKGLIWFPRFVQLWFSVLLKWKWMSKYLHWLMFDIWVLCMNKCLHVKLLCTEKYKFSGAVEFHSKSRSRTPLVVRCHFVSIDGDLLYECKNMFLSVPLRALFALHEHSCFITENNFRDLFRYAVLYYFLYKSCLMGIRIRCFYCHDMCDLSYLFHSNSPAQNIININYQRNIYVLTTSILIHLIMSHTNIVY